MIPHTRQQLGNMPGIHTMIELGVAAAKFAELLLDANQTIRYIGIDRWSDHHDEAEYQNARNRLSKFRGRAILYKSTFDDALPLFPNGAWDMVYVDGYAHTGQDNGKTLADWWPKVRSGGIFAGHDYSPDYPQTIKAVDEFVAKLQEAGEQVTLHIIKEQPHDSWWIRKA